MLDEFLMKSNEISLLSLDDMIMLLLDLILRLREGIKIISVEIIASRLGIKGKSIISECFCGTINDLGIMPYCNLLKTIRS